MVLGWRVPDMYSMSGGWYSKGHPDSHIPGLVDPVYITRGQVPESRSIEASSKDVKDLDLNLRISVAELLHQRVYFPNKLSSLNTTVYFHRVVTLQHIAQVFHLLNPWERVPIEQYRSSTMKIFIFLGENYAFRF